MPQLAYCIIESGNVMPALSGVDDATIGSIQWDGMLCLISRASDKVSSGNTFQEQALKFHRVLNEIFERTAIIPFRFPTIFAAEQNITAHLEEHSSQYRKILNKLQGAVQMEIRLRLRDSASPVTEPGLSGREYLQNIRARHLKLEATAAQFRKISAHIFRAWKQNDSTGAIRCYALVNRTAMSEFQEALAKVQVEPGVAARLSGPWPPTQFLTGD